MINKNNIIWLAFFFHLGLISLNLINNFLGFMPNLEQSQIFRFLIIGIPVLILIWHAILTLSLRRALLFVVLAAGIGWLMEVWGLNSGVVFGGHYLYSMNQVALFQVPISVIAYWVVFIYTGYSVTNSFLLWLKRKKPDIKLKNYWLLPLTVVFDGLLVVAIDLFMDPIQVASGNWQWLEGGLYFGVPIGNFIGWFIVAVLVTGIFRSYEYFFSVKNMRFNKSLYLMPVLGYGALATVFTMEAVKYQMANLALVGNSLMLPVVLLNLFLFYRKNNIN